MARRGPACPLAMAIVMAMAAAAAAGAGKRNENEFLSPMPFVLGSRYGRSPQRLISPRNDRFFMGSRYGKRSGLNVDGSRPGLALTRPALETSIPLDPGEPKLGSVTRLDTGGERLGSTNMRLLGTKLGTEAGDWMRQGETRLGVAARPGVERLGMERLGLESVVRLECAPTAAFSLYRCVPAHYRTNRRPEEWLAGRLRTD